MKLELFTVASRIAARCTATEMIKESVLNVAHMGSTRYPKVSNQSGCGQDVPETHEDGRHMSSIGLLPHPHAFEIVCKIVMILTSVADFSSKSP